MEDAPPLPGGDEVSRAERSLLAAVYQGIRNLFFPNRCASCGKSLQPSNPHCLCGECWDSLPRIRQPYCPRCGRPIGSRTVVPYDTLCGECRLAGHCFGLCRSAGRYDGTLRECIHILKYGGRRELAQPLAAFMADFAAEAFAGERYDGLVPVPLHPAKLRERGFNQALLLARGVGSLLNIPVRSRVLARIRRGETQSTLSRAERLKNVRGAFSLRSKEGVKGLSLLLIDDVFTTGATAEECARVLLKGGARKVDVFTAARAV